MTSYIQPNVKQSEREQKKSDNAGRVSTRSQNCEMRLLASSCLSVRPHRTTRFSLDRFSWNWISQYFSKISRNSSGVIKTCKE